MNGNPESLSLSAPGRWFWRPVGLPRSIFAMTTPGRMLGDGYRLAFEAGAILQDMEFVQFYPVCLAEPGHYPMVIPPRLADLRSACK